MRLFFSTSTEAMIRRCATMPAKTIPDDYPAITPSLAFENAAEAIDFYKNAFGAVETMRLAWGNGRIGHSELTIGTGKIMLADEFPPFNATPKRVGGTPVVLHLFVEDVDAFVARAAAAGATIVMPPKDQFYGDRSARVSDPFGYIWSFGTRIEDVSPEEMQIRWTAVQAQMSKS